METRFWCEQSKIFEYVRHPASMVGNMVSGYTRVVFHGQVITVANERTALH